MENKENNVSKEVHYIHNAESSDVGKTFGILGMVLGGVSIIFLGLVFVPLGILFSVLAFWKKKYLFGSIGLLLSFIGIMTSPTIWAVFVAFLQ